jgi:erythronate-4-phosphate dehydrogenase
LLVRSVTQVNEKLLAGSRVRFVGSATIGSDHLDLDWLAQQGITVTTAPGCNARSVVDYVLTALVHLAHRFDFDLSGRVLGVVGLGNVGYLLAKDASSLGLTVIGCDPFVRRADIAQTDLMHLLATADIVSLHTPLTRGGDHPTFHLLHAGNLPALKPGAILLNSGRGAVIDNQALLQFLQARPQHLLATVLDVWENEPLPDRELVSAVTIATPHIAGYSLEGRWGGTEQVYQAVCRFLGIAPQHRLDEFLPPVRMLSPVATDGSDWAVVQRLLQQVYPLCNDDAAMRNTLANTDENERASAFDRLRKDYWPRRDFPAYRIGQAMERPVLRQVFQRLGFQLTTAC